MSEQTPEYAHDSFGTRDTSAEAIERVWREFWLPSLRGEDGKVSLHRLKAELYDCHHLIMAAPKVYHHVTGGLCDDPCASAEGVIAEADRRREELTRALRDEIERQNGEIALLKARIQDLERDHG